jgi:hypothetical protein
MNRYQRGAGNDLGVYRGTLFQKGYGLGGTFRRFFKWIILIFEKHALPTFESGVKEIGKQALTSVSNITRDVAAGKNLKESAREHVQSAIDNLKSQVENKLAGKGIKRRSKFKDFIILRKKQKYKDIFS